MPGSQTHKNNGKSLRITVALVGLAVTALVGLMYTRIFVPEPHLKPIVPAHDYDLASMRKAVTPDNIRKYHDEILALGSRFIGQDGMYATADYIEQKYKDAGLEMYEQTSWVAAPKSDVRIFEPLEPSDKPVPEIYPFFPNHMQPMCTPPEGLEGTLMLVTEDMLASEERFDDIIGLIDCREEMVPKDWGFSWLRYARQGFKALIVAHPEDGLAGVPWERTSWREGMVASVPVNYVRLAATPEIFNFVNQRVRLKVKTRYANTKHRTVMGLLRAGDSTRENPSGNLLIVNTSYDAMSFLPDAAPGDMQAISIALQLALLDGLRQYRPYLQRDVLFMSGGAHSMAQDDENSIMRVLNLNTAKAKKNRLAAAVSFGSDEEKDVKQDDDSSNLRMGPILERKESNDESLQFIEQILPLFDDPAFYVDSGVTKTRIKAFDKELRSFFEEQHHYVMNDLIFELGEPRLKAKIAFERIGGEDQKSDEFRDYQEKRRAYERVSTASGYAITNLLQKKPDMCEQYHIRERARARFEELQAYHNRRKMQIEQNTALVELFEPYEGTVVVEPWLVPAFSEEQQDEVLSFDAGQNGVLESQAYTFRSVLATSKQMLGIGDELTIDTLSENQFGRAWGELGMRPPGYIWAEAGFPCYTMFNFKRGESYRRFAAPTSLPFMHDLASLKNCFDVAGTAVLSLATGTGVFPPTTITGWNRASFGGQVLVANVGQSVVPNFPLQNALVGCGPRYNSASFGKPGFQEHPFYFTDPYGRYDLYNQASDFPNYNNIWLIGGYSPLAVGYGEDGLISYIKDEGEEGQRLYKSLKINRWNISKLKNVIIVMFRASPITVLDLTNPQTLKDYTGMTLCRRDGLETFRKECLINDAGIATTFVEPDENFYVQLEAGTPDNEYAKVTRGFMLGTVGADGPQTPRQANYRLDERKTIDGPGFLAADSPILIDIPKKTARSMTFVNQKRIDMQNEFGMADERTNDYMKKGKKLLAESEVKDQSHHQAIQYARQSVTYATLNHPVLRESIFEAVIGILWYLGLLVPFVFFFEKLVFGFPDIRKQLAAQAVIFIVVFGLLRVLHPAFEMVRSSLMILLSFVIVLISGGTMLLFSDKFKENLEDLKRKRGKVSAAEVNTLAVTGSAFMLGLNNMHRRKMRTGMTCITLTLLTFVMICFTSAENDLVDQSEALGKARYQGLLIKRERFRPISDSESFVVNEKYDQRYDVCVRRMMFGRENWVEKQRLNPDLEMVYMKNGRERELDFDSVLQFSFEEPMAPYMTMLTNNPWFTEDNEIESEDTLPIFISDVMARSLGISAGDVDAGWPDNPVTVLINGRNFHVKNIFDSQVFDSLRDLDDVDLLPYDIETLKVVTKEHMGGDDITLAEPHDPRIPSQNCIITPLRDLRIKVDNSYMFTNSIAVSMPGVSYKDAKQEIVSYMEQTGKPAFYGLDGVGYVGKRTRETSIAGVLDMLIPLVLAALTVLNTMRGSVYERRDEIFVYNAVGIAPKYVFLMFFAEAVVYAVVGSVMGYLLSQGTGRILSTIHFTGGLNMSFTSLTTIYASLTIAGAVFFSTYFPAKSAMEIAAPAEESGWSLPEPKGDVLSFDLPFTFGKRDRVAVMAFFARYLEDHGEGSAGRFYAGNVTLGVAEASDPLADDGYIPATHAPIWLKPFDLGVSQRMDILLPTDPETREYKAQIVLTRLSGTREAWLRLNKGFVALMRQHFLHWRAVGDEQRQEMFVEAKQLMDTTCEMA